MLRVDLSNADSSVTLLLGCVDSVGCCVLFVPEALLSSSTAKVVKKRKIFARSRESQPSQ